MTVEWDAEQARLQRRAGVLRERLGIDEALARIGSATLVGSAALGVMVARDIDVTVTVSALGSDVRTAVAELAACLSIRDDVREVTLRNDLGRWNTDPLYPDGIYLHVHCADIDDEPWTIDIWFVDDPARQPDLQHLETIGSRITAEAQATILAIKRATGGRRPDGSRLPSILIYEAVLDHGVLSAGDFSSIDR
ncbi:hypothetical protein ACL9RL_00615 [Plantibacter sp. Mn2098]|uniref:hypothetical protein n=1 Tax=Plantibacter sp. Mn2098 TaxID=3395266 RepID=UPI003BBA5775